MPVSIHTENAPAAIGPYSQAVTHGGLVYCSGQIPLDPKTGQLVEGTIAQQTERVMENMSAVLTAAGSGLDRVLKTTIFLTAMSDFAEVNAAYGKYFAGAKPARSTVAVKELPKGARVEVDCIAAL